MRRLLAVVLTALLAATVAPALTAPAGAAVSVRLRAAIKNLPVASETRAGYDRDKFNHWVDADGDCRDTRDEVLAAESRTRVAGCDVRSGRWFSYYDRATWSASSDVDVDHLVALAEAWDSGARRWTSGTRTRFANDLGDRRSLVAVTDNVNMSKSDRDPAEWMPTFGRCRYVREWTAVKIRWSLTVNRAEKSALLSQARRCPNTVLRVRKARVARSTGGNTGGGGGGGGLDPRFSYCYQAMAAGYGPYYRGRDAEYYWYTDGDGDGAVCE